MNVLIIEDEKKAAVRLAEIVKSIDDTIDVVAIIDSIDRGIEWFSLNNLPDLIFSDIELADGVSFELFKQVHIACPIIFCTAYNQYMVDAFETNAVSYILKPYNRDMIEKALIKYHSMRNVFADRSREEGKETVDTLLKVLSGDVKSRKSTFIANVEDKIIPVAADSIAYVYATSGGMQMVTLAGKEYAYHSTLDEIMEELDPGKFFHASRQFIISKTAITSVERYFNRKLFIKLIVPTPEQVLISRLKAKSFIEWMEK